MSDRYPHPTTMSDDALQAYIIDRTAQMREAQRSFFRRRKAGEDAFDDLQQSRVLERVVDGAVAVWQERQAGNAAEQGTLFP